MDTFLRFSFGWLPFLILNVSTTFQVRACLKSLALAVMFPISITFFFLPYNRTL